MLDPDKDYENYCNNLLNKLRSKDPLWKQREEYGALLMINRKDFTPEQEERFNELSIILQFY